jgi:hypothetical protein
MCFSAQFYGKAITAGNFAVSIESADNSHFYTFANVGPNDNGSILNNCAPLDSTGGAHWYINPNGATIANGQYVVFGAPMWNIGRQLQAFTDSFGGANYPPSTSNVTSVAGLPTAAGGYTNNRAGQFYTVNDWNGTIGACVGGGSLWGQAIWNGSGWSCH